VAPECQVQRLKVGGHAGARVVEEGEEGNSIAGHVVVACSIDKDGNFEVKLGAGTIFGPGLCTAG
jgi:hypothetical protein